MGIRLKKPLKTNSAVPPPTKLKSLSGDDLYLYVESGLMACQQRLAEFRQGDFLTKPIRLEMLVSEFDAVTVGLQEMQARTV
jgi:hypothetical protein